MLLLFLFLSILCAFGAVGLLIFAVAENQVWPALLAGVAGFLSWVFYGVAENNEL